MPNRLVNEKTLELNITHEAMLNAGVSGVFGFTQEQESRIGADVFFPIAKPLILQFKAAKAGVDDAWADFQVNNNKWRNQHRALDAIARSGLADARYAFPLIIGDAFLTSHFGNLTNFTCLIDARQLTGNLNWIGQTHMVNVQRGCGFTVSSLGEVKGEGVSARQFFDNLSKKREEKSGERNLSEFAKDLIKKMDEAVQKSEIYGQSEHTLVIIGTDANERRLGYLQLPVRIRGLKRTKDKSMF